MGCDLVNCDGFCFWEILEVGFFPSRNHFKKLFVVSRFLEHIFSILFFDSRFSQYQIFPVIKPIQNNENAGETKNFPKKSQSIKKNPNC